MSELIKYINELPGYKISDTHFRLGSKIHIAHFYYAKRLFQNSFFASRLAFLIAKEILTDHRDKIKEFESGGLTLIGYGLYSELLISLVEKFLKKKLSPTKINHDLISDADEPSFIKNYGDTYKYIIIIVPIGSTFSTAIKIKEFLTDKPNDNEILEPFINVLHISHFPSDPNDKPDAKGLYKIEKNFGWTDRKGKTIWIKDLSARPKESEEENIEKNGEENKENKEVKKQKYLLALKSEWHDVKNCSLCALDGQSIERPLYFTDKSSVTPTLIFGKPKAREIEKRDKNKFILSPEILQCAHLKRNANHYHYYIKIEEFFQANIEKIESWLDILKQKDDFKKSFDETSRVIIIAPGHYSNAGFINLVNEKLFSNAANIIHYDTFNDHISNFGLLYGKELQENGTQVLFVDDAITTGSTFRKINFFVENTFIEKTGKAKAFNACIFMMDRSNLTVHRNIIEKTDKYYSFANLHLPSLKDFDGECPLDIGFKRYDELAKNSFLTRLQIQFLTQKDKLQERYIDSTKNENKNSGHNDEKRYIRQVEAIHRIYEWSRNQNHNFDQTFEDWKKSLLDQTESPFSHEELRKNSTDINGLSDETATLLKILTHSPFIHYKPVKDNLFNWVLTMLKGQIDIIEKEIDEGAIQYGSFRDLKFLIRRAGLLNTNFLISKNILNFLSKIYDQEKGLDKLIVDIKEQTNKLEELKNRMSGLKLPTLFDKSKEELEAGKEKLESKLENVRDFHVFYTAQIKELLYLNEARSIRLEETINELNADIKFPDFPNSYKQLLRFIQEENGILILSFWDFIKKKLDGIGYDELDKDRNIIKILDNNTVKEHYKAKALNEFLSLSGDGAKKLHKNIPFINFLKLMHFFEIESKEENLKLNDKTDFVLDRLRKIICYRGGMQNDTIGNDKSGAFFLVRYKKKADTFLAYNKGSSGGIDETILKQDIYLNEFLNPPDDNKLTETILEFHKTDGKWYDLYATGQTKNELGNNFKFIPDGCNRLLIVRFCRLKVDPAESDARKFKERLSNEGKAIAGFYFERQGETITDITLTRFLLLLRSSISDFIERHHENDEFRDWVEADNRKRTELLTGHGREMLIEVATNHPEYRNIINTILLVQMLILHLQEEKAFKLKNDDSSTGKTVINVFKNLYKPAENSKIDNAYLFRLKGMAEHLFSLNEIENKVDKPFIPNITFSYKQDFKFPTEIIDMICFEIFVNAKKNRWLFIDSDSLTKNGKKWTNNEIEIEGKLDNGFFILTISNTGPGAGDISSKEIINKLNNKEDPKGYKSVAGLKLIRKLLEDFELGDISYDSEQICGDFYKFIVKLTLKNWNNELQYITN